MTSMIAPPCYLHSLESRNQFFNSGPRQERRFGTQGTRKIRARNRDIPKLVGQNLHLAVADMSRQASHTSQL